MFGSIHSSIMPFVRRKNSIGSMLGTEIGFDWSAEVNSSHCNCNELCLDLMVKYGNSSLVRRTAPFHTKLFQFIK